MNRDRIGKYRILGELGRGTMGEVYEALDPVLNRRVALKTLSVRVGPEDEALGRFQQEARAAALLNHPNIVTIHDFGEERGRLYMAMELLEGNDLRDAIDRDTLKDLGQKLDVMDPVLAALDYAHSKGVVHRDIKPANIHLGPGGQVKIMDFGLARLGTSEMTQDGIVLGTPNYMSPEQALGDRVDAQSDVFSTGAVLYELLTGHKPFEADSTPSVLYQVVHREPPPVKRWAPEVPESIVAVVDRALAKERKSRYASAAEMRAALAAARQIAPPALPFAAESSLPRPSASSPSLSLPGARARRAVSMSVRAARRRRPSRVAPLFVGAGLALMLLAGAAFVWLRPPQTPAPTPASGGAHVDDLTRALVATQIQLVRRELEDKNWSAAAAQAESVLRLAPDHPEAARSLDEARARLRGLEEAITAGRGRLAAGDAEGASEQLSRLLELDPRHPAAAELSARLNDAFRSEVETAAASMRVARDEARTAGAAGTPEFAAAEATVQQAVTLAQGEEFADATRIFLEARDAFDRARRAAHAPTPSPPTPARADTRPPDTGRPAAAATSSVSSQPAPPEPARSATDPPAVHSFAGAASATGHPRRFTADETTITTPSAGELAGFETEDVRTQRPPRFTGRIDFEVLPSEVRPGETFMVRVHLVNQGKETVRIRRVELVTVEDGQRTATPAKAIEREAAAYSSALVAEYSSVWSATGRWALEAVISADGDERVRSRLVSN